AAASACASKAAPLASRASLRRMRLARRLDPALVPFLWSRAAIWGAAILFAFWLAPDRPRRHGPTPGGNGYWLHLWANWDGAWFAQIAQHGYATTAGTGAFYPLYPAALAVLGRVFAGHYVAAGVVLALAACAAAFVLLYRLTALELGEDAARRATLALAVGAFLAARTGRWTLAGAATALAFLTRPTAIGLWLALLLLAWRAPERR